MKLVVKCSVCQNKLAEISKEVVTQDDVQKYEQMIKCVDHEEQPIVEVVE